MENIPSTSNASLEAVNGPASDVLAPPQAKAPELTQPPLHDAVGDGLERDEGGLVTLIPVSDEDEFLLVAERKIAEHRARGHQLGHRLMEEALALGGILHDVKTRLGRGHWLRFLSRVGVQPRTAQNYLRLYARGADLRVQYENNSHCTLTQALTFVRALEKPEQPEVQSADSNPAPTQPSQSLGVFGQALTAEQIEARLPVARTISPMKDYDAEKWGAFAVLFRELAQTLHRAATEGVVGCVVPDEMLFEEVDALRKFLVKRRKERESAG